MEKLKLYDFWAEWCAPCKAMMPVVEAMAEKFKDRIELVKVNVDDQQTIADMFGIRAMPTLVLMQGDQEKVRWVGAMSATKLELELQRALAIENA